MPDEPDDSPRQMQEATDKGPLAPGLYLVATPIGNLEDITLRAIRILRSVDRIACEDTRQTGKLLHYYDIKTPTVSYHLHNERSRAEELVAQLKAGARIAVVSDAGTPGIADPGEEIVRAAAAAGIAIYPIPGANAALCALIASGLPTEHFAFRGFLPSKPGERRSFLEALHAELRAATVPATQILYETPHRIADALADIEAVFGPTHPIALARELTKLHEEFLRGTAAEVRTNVAARENIRGEMVLVISGVIAAEETAQVSLAAAVKALLATGLDEKDALKQVARDRNIGKSEAYREYQRTKAKR